MLNRGSLMRMWWIWVSGGLLLLAVVFFMAGVVSAEAEAGGSRSLQIAAVQMRWSIEDYASAETFKAKMKALMERVKVQRKEGVPCLVVFPEDVGTPLIFVGLYDRVKDAPTLRDAINRAVKGTLIPVLWKRVRYGVGWVRGLALARADVAAKIYVDTFSGMAKEYGVYIVAGSICIPDYEIVDGRLGKRTHRNGGNVYNVSYFFGPDGRIIGTQKKSYLTEIESANALDLLPGKVEEMKVFDTAIGKIAIAICLDSFKDDVVEKLAAGGGEILIQPSANPGLWSKEQQEDWLNSSWGCTYRNKRFKYAVNPMMVGSLFDLVFEGQSSIVAEQGPFSGEGYMSLSVGEGFLKVAHSKDREEILVAEVEL